MKSKLTFLLSVFLCGILIASLLLTLSAHFLQHTMFNAAFYQQVTASPDYLPLVYHSIENDLSRQSNVVAIPKETLQAGLSEEQVYINLRNHVINAVAFLNFEEEFRPSQYPAEPFYEELSTFIAEHAAQEGYAPDAEQYELLAEVADDSARIVSRHVNLVNFDLVRQMGAFQRLHQALHRLSRQLGPALLTMLASLACLVFLHKRQLSRGALHALTSLWLAGSFFFVPALVMEFFALTRRLAIETPYLKYAADELLTYANRYLLVWGLILLVFSSIGLVVRILIDRPRRQSRR